MDRIAFGIDSPKALFGKLRFDAGRLDEEINPYDVFNFFITASVLYEWTKKHYKNSNFVRSITSAITEERPLLIPELALEWIEDSSCIPNNERDFRVDIFNVLSACNYTANASKHYHWFKSNPVTAVETEPQIKDWHQYFFTSVESGLYMEVNGQYYNLFQIKGAVLQYYVGLLNYLESGNDNA